MLNDIGIMPTPCRCYKDINKTEKAIRHEKCDRNHLKGRHCRPSVVGKASVFLDVTKGAVFNGLYLCLFIMPFGSLTSGFPLGINLHLGSCVYGCTVYTTLYKFGLENFRLQIR